MKEENLGLALLITKKAGAYGKVFTSTAKLAELTGFSQQSISRKLREMEQEGVLSRNVSNAGIELSLTEKGRQELKSLFLELQEIFSRKKVSLKGRVVDGLGEGTYYTSLPQYKKQFLDLFKIKLFPGTLNLIVDPADRATFTSNQSIVINGFKTPKRTFGGIDSWKCKVNGKVNAVAILPHRSNHPANVIELVAPFSLRKKLKLNNKSTIELVRA